MVASFLGGGGEGRKRERERDRKREDGNRKSPT